MNSRLPYLNVGCGHSFHSDWTNIDFISTGPNVIAHNLLNGIPARDNTFKVVYHSHVLEHFKKEDGEKFIGECYRVLSLGGTLRIAVPDLQKIIGEYTRIVAALKDKKDDLYLNASYDWIMLEMFDQTLRTVSGGNMEAFLRQDNLINEDFVLERCGYEVKTILERYRMSKNNSSSADAKVPESLKSSLKNGITVARSIPSRVREILKKKMFGEDFEHFYKIGKFRSSGEIHQWMYDEHSLGRLLKETGFKNTRVCTAFESGIENWNQFALETVDGKIRKPDSLFMEASK